MIQHERPGLEEYSQWWELHPYLNPNKKG
jgi:hypothetical protein